MIVFITPYNISDFKFEIFPKSDITTQGQMNTRSISDERSPLVLTIFIWLIVPALTGLTAIWMGQDANWDLRNYHYYNPYAFLNDRLSFDALPSQIPTFYNPLFYVPYYYAVTWLPPKAVAFVLGVVQGFNFPILFAISRIFLSHQNVTHSRAIGLGIALTGIIGASNISEFGTMFSDNLLSLLILASLWMILRHASLFFTPNRSLQISLVLAAGTLAGLAFGLKQPTVMYAIGLCAAFFAFRLSFRQNFVLSFLFGIGVLTGMAVTSGFWLAEMWRRFKNPLFPYFNDVFKSPMADIWDYRDIGFLPMTIGEALMRVMSFAIEPLAIAEVPFTDFRLPLLYILCLILMTRWVSNHFAPVAASWKKRPQDAVLQSCERFFVAFFVISYLVWLKMFSIFRYALVLELLAPLGIWLAVYRLFRSEKSRRVAVMLCFGFILCTLDPASWGRVEWGDDYFGADLPQIDAPEQTIILMTGTDPISYLIPLFSPQIRFLRIQSYFNLFPKKRNGYDEWMADILDKHAGPVFVLYRSSDRDATVSALASYGLELQAGLCPWFKPRIENNLDDVLRFCKVYRIQ